MVMITMSPLCARCLALLAMLLPVTASAFVAGEEAVPQRPLVLDPGTWELAGGAHLRVLGDSTPDSGLSDVVLVPLSGAVALSERWELGLRADTWIRPDLGVSLTPRCRFALDNARMFAVGVAVTLPLGYLTDHLGPEGLPVRLELPAFRLESAAAALRAGLSLAYHLQEGPDAKSLDLDAAGVVRVAGPVFAAVHLGIAVPDLEPGDAQVGLGLGVGWLITQRIIGKVEGFAPDLGSQDTWQVAVLLITKIETLEKSPDAWL
jgi:hypothetical protein